MSHNKNNILFFGVLIVVFVIFAVLGSFSSYTEDTPFIETTAITTETETTTETTSFATALTTVTEAPTISDLSAEIYNTVYIGKTGTKYHKQDCGSLKGKGTAISFDEAIAQGRTPCKICKP